jgi:hypothetical protein
VAAIIPYTLDLGVRYSARTQQFQRAIGDDQFEPVRPEVVVPRLAVNLRPYVLGKLPIAQRLVVCGL